MDWYYAQNGQQKGPVSREKLEEMLNSGEVKPTDLVWNESMPDWKPVGSLQEFQSGGPAAEGSPAPAAPPSDEAPPLDSSEETSPAVATTASAAGPAPATGEKVPTYLWQSIVCLVLCCLPAAVVAIIYSVKVEPALQRGNVAEAKEASQKAKLWCWIAFGLGLVANVLFFIFGLVGAMAEAGTMPAP